MNDTDTQDAADTAARTMHELSCDLAALLTTREPADPRYPRHPHLERAVPDLHDRRQHAAHGCANPDPDDGQEPERWDGMS